MVMSVFGVMTGCEKSAPEKVVESTPGAEQIGQMQSGAITSVTASSSYGNLDAYKPENAFDGNEATVWAASGSNPVSLIITPSRTGTIESIKLVSRRTSLLEQWHKLVVKLYLKNERVSEETFSFPDATTQKTHEVSIKPVQSDKIELNFSEPVTKTLGGESVNAAAVNPGYAEIVLKWKQ
jgi:hypothetical protein